MADNSGNTLITLALLAAFVTGGIWIYSNVTKKDDPSATSSLVDSSNSLDASLNSSLSDASDTESSASSGALDSSSINPIQEKKKSTLLHQLKFSGFNMKFIDNEFEINDCRVDPKIDDVVTKNNGEYYYFSTGEFDANIDNFFKVSLGSIEWKLSTQYSQLITSDFDKYDAYLSTYAGLNNSYVEFTVDENCYVRIKAANKAKDTYAQKNEQVDKSTNLYLVRNGLNYKDCGNIVNSLGYLIDPYNDSLDFNTPIINYAPSIYDAYLIPGTYRVCSGPAAGMRLYDISIYNYYNPVELAMGNQHMLDEFNLQDSDTKDKVSQGTPLNGNNGNSLTGLEQDLRTRFSPDTRSYIGDYELGDPFEGGNGLCYSFEPVGAKLNISKKSDLVIWGSCSYGIDKAYYGDDSEMDKNYLWKSIPEWCGDVSLKNESKTLLECNFLASNCMVMDNSGKSFKSYEAPVMMVLRNVDPGLYQFGSPENDGHNFCLYSLSIYDVA